MQDEALQVFQKGAIKKNSCNEHHSLHLQGKKEIWITLLSTDVLYVVASTSRRRIVQIDAYVT